MIRVPNEIMKLPPALKDLWAGEDGLGVTSLSVAWRDFSEMLPALPCEAGFTDWYTKTLQQPDLQVFIQVTAQWIMCTPCTSQSAF